MADGNDYGKTRSAQARRRAILAVGRDFIARRGVAGSTMQDIALAVGIGRKTLYRYFANVETLAQAVMAGIIESGETFGRGFVPPGGDGRERLRAACRAYCEHCLANPELLRFYYEYDYHFRRPHSLAIHRAWSGRPNIFHELALEGAADGSLRIDAERARLVGVALPNAILASAQRLACRGEVLELEYGYRLGDLPVLADMLVDGLP